MYSKSFSLNNPDHAYIYGLLWADGYVIYKTEKPSRYEIQLELKREDDYLLRLIQSELGGNLYKYNRFDKRTNKVYSTSVLRILNKNLVKIILDLGFRKIMKVPKKNLRHFVRGFFDGDGSISPSGNSYYINFAGNKKTKFTHLSKMKLFDKFQYYGFKNSRGCMITLRNKKYTKSFLNWIYKDINEHLKLDRKYNKYCLYCVHKEN